MGWSLNLRRNALGDQIGIAERFSVANAHHPITLGHKPGVTLGVAQLRLGIIVPAAVDLDDKPRSVMNEVNDIAPNRRLPADMEIERAESPPKGPLTGGHLIPETAGAFDDAGCMSRPRRF